MPKNCDTSFPSLGFEVPENIFISDSEIDEDTGVPLLRLPSTNDIFNGRLFNPLDIIIIKYEKCGGFVLNNDFLSNRVSTVLFDLDGTLIDTNDLIIESLNHTLKKHLGYEVPRHELIRHFGKPLRDHFIEYGEENCNLMIETYRQYNVLNHDSLVKEYPSVKETLIQLANKGIQLGIVSSKVRRVVLMGLNRFELLSFFKCVVCADDVNKHKPDPEPVLSACRLLNVVPHNSIMVGDSPYDMMSADAAGAIPIGVAWSNFNKDVLLKSGACKIIGNMSELTKMI
jgi:pyrophosphatase PpaX